ncbi:hypothetical protein, partial [Pseudomonas aeruginosa]|uniref:hypothetical protein n=1 Tax=Pseudomonas aeruginosa TaxID=287 RepID=UPI001ABCB611
AAGRGLLRAFSMQTETSRPDKTIRSLLDLRVVVLKKHYKTFDDGFFPEHDGPAPANQGL